MPRPDSADEAGAAALAQLLARVADGDRHAFEQLYASVSPRLFGICLRLLRERADAEDTLQEVFATIWHKAGQFDPGKAAAMTWLATLARNRAIDRLRAAPPRGSQDPIELAEVLADEDGAGPMPAAEAASDRARLEHCLGGLEPRRSTLIRAAFFDGSTYEELAHRSGSPLGSVKSWIRRGLAQLRTCLER